MRRNVGQQADLQLTCGVEILFESAFVLAHAFVQPCVLERDGDVGRQRDEHLLVLLRKSVVLGALESDHADLAVLEDQRNTEFAAHLDLVPALPRAAWRLTYP